MFGPTEASKRTKVPERTIRGWAALAGVKVPALIEKEAAKVTEVAAVLAPGSPQVTAAEVQEARITIEQQNELKRRMINQDLLKQIHNALLRMDEPHVEFFATKDDVVSRTYPKAPSNAFRNYAQAFSILYREFRLESGEATDRTEHSESILAVVKDETERRRLITILDMALEDEQPDSPPNS